jgi:hypothetical protein
MKGLLLVLWGLTAVDMAQAAPPHAGALQQHAVEWRFVGHSDVDDAAQCQLQAEGSVLDDAGADVTVDCTGVQGLVGNVQLALPTTSLQQRRVTLIAEMNSDDTLLASVWLKTAHGQQTLMFEDDAEQMLFGGQTVDGWQVRRLTLPVDVPATELRLGVLLQGHGKMSLRNVRVQVSEPGAMSSDALTYLDNVLTLLKQQTTDGNAAQWLSLEPQMRLLSSGAQTTADVYPAIRYALAALGDRRNMLLTPEIARAIHSDAQSQDGSSATRTLLLSDGAQLVLANLSILRTAQNNLPATSRLATP